MGVMNTKDTVVIGFVARGDYAEFRALCADASLPIDYDAFLENVRHNLENTRAMGIFPVQVNIKPAEMVAWCKAQGRPVDSNARADYAVAVYNAINKQR